MATEIYRCWYGFYLAAVVEYWRPRLNAEGILSIRPATIGGIPNWAGC